MPPARGGIRERGSQAALRQLAAPLLLLLCFSCSPSVSAATPSTSTSIATTTAALGATGAAANPLTAATAAAAAAAAASVIPPGGGDDDDDEVGSLAAPPSAAATAGVTAATAGAAASTAATAATGPIASAASAAQLAGFTGVASAPAAAAKGTGHAASVLSDRANATGNGAASLPFISYSDPGPAVPFNLEQFLDIQRQNFITHVVDDLLRISGDASAQPVRVPPGPLVDQPELRPPGQRWRFLPLSAEQQAAAEGAQKRLGAAAEGAQKRLGAAADDAQAAATRTATRLGLPPENAPPALPGSSGSIPPPNPFRNLTRRYNSSKARRSNFRRGPTNSSSSQMRFNSTSGTYSYEDDGGLGGPLADAAAAASDAIDDAAPVGIATVPAVREGFSSSSLCDVIQVEKR